MRIKKLIALIIVKNIHIYIIHREDKDSAKRNLHETNSFTEQLKNNTETQSNDKWWNISSVYTITIHNNRKTPSMYNREKTRKNVYIFHFGMV